jgi:hypothetical protein
MPERPARIAIGYPDEVAGRGELPNQVARLVSRALRDAKEAGLGRADVAARLSRELGRKVTESILEGWASEADVAHRIPFDAFAALVKVTGAVDLLGFMPGLSDFVVVPRRYMAVIELHLLEEFERALADHKAKLQADVRALR